MRKIEEVFINGVCLKDIHDKHKKWVDEREERKEHNLLLEVKQVIILCPNPCVKSLIIDFHEHTRLIRKTYLLRNQDRGSDDSSDNYCYNKVTLLTA